MDYAEKRIAGKRDNLTGKAQDSRIAGIASFKLVDWANFALYDRQRPNLDGSAYCLTWECSLPHAEGGGLQ